jgi:type IV secretion system protein VirB9
MRSSPIGYLTFLVAMLCTVGFAGTAHATREPRPIQIDHRVRTIIYQADQVYKYTGHYHYQSSIEFGTDERIQTISMGDSTAWMLNPSGFRLFLKPIEQDATTNMTIITNRRTYLFELHARETDDIDDKDMVFIMRFIYPDGNTAGGGRAGSGDTITKYLDSVPSPEDNPGAFNLNYSIAGTDVIAPVRIFDDGQFTYFQFRNKNADLPAFYMADDEGNEALINFRTRGDYIVVERVAKKFTLRHGNLIVCVFNESYTPLGELPPENPGKDNPSGKYAPATNAAGGKTGTSGGGGGGKGKSIAPPKKGR